MTGLMPGLYGKLPARGDFVRLGLDREFVSGWDAWIGARMTAARRALRERWHDAYVSAPIWRFTLARGIAGRETMLGVLMPSVDRVGRQFPLTLALPAGRADPLMLHAAASEAFAILEEAALSALDDAEPEAVAEAGRVALPRVPRSAAVKRPGLTFVGPDPFAAVAASLQPYARPSVWTAETTSGTRFHLTEGLPGDAAFRAFLDPADPMWTSRAEAPA